MILHVKEVFLVQIYEFLFWNIQRILRNRAREERGQGKEVRVGYKTIRIADKQFRWDEERQQIVETETRRTFRSGRKQIYRNGSTINQKSQQGRREKQ